MIVITVNNENGIADSIPELWGMLNDEQRLYLKENAEIRIYDKHELIYEENQQPSHIFVLIKGKVKVYKSGASGRSQIIRFIKPTGLFGFRGLNKYSFDNAFIVRVDINHDFYFTKENNEIKLNKDQMQTIVNNLHQEDEIWDVLDSYVMEEIARAVKEDI